MQTGRAMHRNLGLVEICETCVAMQAMNPDPTSMFVKHDGDVKEVTRALVSATKVVSVAPEKKKPMRSVKQIQDEINQKENEIFALKGELEVAQLAAFFEANSVPEGVRPIFANKRTGERILVSSFPSHFPRGFILKKDGTLSDKVEREIYDDQYTFIGETEVK